MARVRITISDELYQRLKDNDTDISKVCEEALTTYLHDQDRLIAAIKKYLKGLTA